MAKSVKKRKTKRKKTAGVSIFRRRLASGKSAWVGQYHDPSLDKVKTLMLSTIGITTREQAQAWAEKKSNRIVEEKVLLKIERRQDDLLMEVTVDELVNRYSAHCKKDLAPRTLKDRLEQHLPKFTTWLADNSDYSPAKHALDITRQHLLGFRKFVTEEKLTRKVPGGKRKQPKLKAVPRERKATSNNVILRSVKAFLNWGIDARLVNLTRDDTRVGLKTLKQQKPLKHWLKPEEIRSLVQAAITLDKTKCQVTRKSKTAGKAWDGELPAKYRPALPALLLLLLGGFRREELAQLRWEGVDLNNEVVTVAYNEATAWSPKVNKERNVTLSQSPLMKEVLENLKSDNGNSLYVFGGDTPWMLSDAQWQRLIKEARLPGVRIKDLRSTCASYLICSPQFGKVPHLVAARMGHTVNTLFSSYAGLIHNLKGYESLEEEMGIADLFLEESKNQKATVQALTDEKTGAA